MGIPLGKIKGSFAATYDKFIRRGSLLPPGLSQFVKSTGAGSILEFGSGTGTVAIGLSLEGYDVTGLDYSEGMLKEARRKAKQYKAEVRFIEGDIIDIDLGRRFDMILCLGNTLALVNGLRDARALFANCLRHLRDDGSAVFQILNYDRILKTRPVTFATDVSEHLVRIKQYRYGRELIDFVVTLVDSSKIPPEVKTARSKLRPWTRKQLASELMRAGFGKVLAFGDYSKSRFSLNSKDLVMSAQR